VRPGDRVSDGLTSEQAKAVTETILGVPVVHAEDEAEAVAALNAGAFVTADPEILEKLGFADFGEDVGEPEDFIDPPEDFIDP